MRSLVRPLRPLPALSASTVLVLLLVTGTGCGIDGEVVAREAAEAAETRATAPETESESESTEPEPGVAAPFTLDVPDGYELVVEGRGEQEREDETAVTVLAPEGEAVGAGVVLVEAVPDPSADRGGFVREAAGRWNALTVAGDGLRAWGVEAGEAELGDVLDAVRAPDEPGAAPEVDDPPGDLEVVGSITVDGVIALGITIHDVSEGSSSVPGPRSGHVAAWRAEGGTLVAVTLPAGTLDPAAVVTEVRPPRRAGDEPRDAVADEVPVGPATGVITTTADGETGRVVRRSLAVETEWGDVLLLIARGPELLDDEALVEVAESVE